MINQLAAREAGTPPVERASGQRWHIITCEYPPQLGGVSDYSRLVAEGLARSGDEVHVWRPAVTGSDTSACLTVHDTLGRAGPTDLWRLGKELNRFSGSPRHLLVQWVPHGYGFRSMNLPFCLWLWGRATWRGDRVEIMVHEAYLAFGEGSWRQNAVALVHRLMAVILLRAASKVWVSIPAWESGLRRYLFGRKTTFQWLPVPSNVPVCSEASTVGRIRQRHLRTRRILLGHFGIHGSLTTRALEEILPALLDLCPDAVMLLIGKGSEEFRNKLLTQNPRLASRIDAADGLAAADLSQCLAACDLMLQPYPDGISTRRTSAMAVLSHGIPLVTTIGHLTEDFWRESDAVVTVPAGNNGAFVNAARRMLDDDSERRRLSSRGRSLYDERFDIQHVIGALRHKSGEID